MISQNCTLHGSALANDVTCCAQVTPDLIRASLNFKKSELIAQPLRKLLFNSAKLVQIS
jgi:hypothetical protein